MSRPTESAVCCAFQKHGSDLQIHRSAAGRQDGLDSQYRCSVQEGTEEPIVLPQKAGILQHVQKDAVDVLPDRGSKYPLLCFKVFY